MTVSPRTTLTPANARTSLMSGTLTESGRWVPAPQDVQVDLVGLVTDGVPGERLHRPPTAREAHPLGAPFVANGIREGGREVRDEPVRIDGDAAAVLHLVDGDEPPGLAVEDHLGDAAGRRGDDRQLAGHRLEVDDAEGLVDG